jgi:hypothetical protein
LDEDVLETLVDISIPYEENLPLIEEAYEHLNSKEDEEMKTDDNTEAENELRASKSLEKYLL